MFYVLEPTGLLVPSWKPVATTDAGGAFRFAVRSSDFGRGATGREMSYASLVAVKEGFGFGWSSASTFAMGDNGRAAHATPRITAAPPMETDDARHEKGPLRLVGDDHPIHGRIVDINGQGVTGRG